MVHPGPRGLCSWRAVTDVDAHLADELAGGEWWASRVPSSVPSTCRTARSTGTPRVRADGEENVAKREKRRLARPFRGLARPHPATHQDDGGNDILRNDLFDRSAPKTMAFGRVALLGDAGHPMLPYLGQGACQAIEDGRRWRDALADAPARSGQRRSRSTAETGSSRRRRPWSSRLGCRASLTAQPARRGARGTLLRRTSTEATLTRLAPIVGGGPGTARRCQRGATMTSQRVAEPAIAHRARSAGGRRCPVARRDITP